MTLDITKTSHRVLPWRLRVRYDEAYGGQWVFVPHAHCRTKIEALLLRAQLQAVADWSVPPMQWSEVTRAAVQAVLQTTEGAAIERAAVERAEKS